MTWEDGSACDGPGFVEWLLAVPLAGREAKDWGDSLRRRMTEWRKGARADFYTVDRYLTQWGMHVSEVPDELWRADNRQDAGSPRTRVLEPLRDCEKCGETIDRKRRPNGDLERADTYRRKTLCESCVWEGVEPSWKKRKAA